jgi:hypothetical protein
MPVRRMRTTEWWEKLPLQSRSSAVRCCVYCPANLMAGSRDGFPKELAPPWKFCRREGLRDACEHFVAKAAKEYPCGGSSMLPCTLHHLSTLRKLQVAGQRVSATCGDEILKLRIAYGTIQMMFRAGPNPTGTRAVSFRDLISTTETSFVCSFAT